VKKYAAMAMFDKHKNSKTSSPSVPESRVAPTPPAMGANASASASKTALIGQGITISGEVKAENSLQIEGRIEGRSVQCGDEIEIAESGQVTANIMARVVKISGLVMGDIDCAEKVLITRSGRVQGNIIAPRVQLEDGALFRGSIDMNPPKAADAEKPVAARPSAAKSESTGNGQKAVTQRSSKSQSSVTDTARKEPSLNLKSG
jgi:cytoskeletal protein CcmA (bactofilin family)